MSIAHGRAERFHDNQLVALLDLWSLRGGDRPRGYIAGPGDLRDPGQGSFTGFDGHCALVDPCILQQAPAAEIHVRPDLDSQGDGSAWDAAIATARAARHSPAAAALIAWLQGDHPQHARHDGPPLAGEPLQAAVSAYLRKSGSLAHRTEKAA